MSNLKIEGVLHRKFATEQKSASFSVREFVVKIPDGQYPQLAKFQLNQDRCDLLDLFQEGDTVEVYFNIIGS